MSAFLPVLGARCPAVCIEVDVTNDPTNPTRVWTDITPLVRQERHTRSGRSDERQRTETGSLAALVDNSGGDVTALGIHRSQWIRVRGQWDGVTYPRWQGIIESIPRTWPSAGHEDLLELRAVGVFKIARLYDLAGETFAFQTNGERVNDILDLVMIPVGDIDSDTDPADAVTDPIAEGTDALQTLLAIEESENGLLVEEPDGTISFQGRHWRLYNSADPVGTFGEAASEIPYRDDVSYEDDDSLVANVVSVTPLGGAAVTVSDAASQDREWTRRLNRSLVTSSATLARSAAEYLLARYRDPASRIPGLTVQLSAAALRDPDLVTTMLAANDSDRFVWKRAAAVAIEDDVFVEQISETITPGSGWDMRLQLSPTGDEHGWLLGDAVYGLLGETTVLTY